MNYSVKKVKSFQGMDGFGYNAELCRDGKPVAFVIDGGNGGSIEIQWKDTQANRVKINIITSDGKPYTYSGTPEEAILAEHLKTLPTEILDGIEISVCKDIFIGELVDEFENDKRYRRLCKKSTLYRKGGNVYSIKTPYNSQVANMLREKHPDLTEILNEKYQG